VKPGSKMTPEQRARVGAGRLAMRTRRVDRTPAARPASATRLVHVEEALDAKALDEAERAAGLPMNGTHF